MRWLNKVEAAQAVWYHGRKVTDQRFDPATTGKGNDREGPGFYFSSDKKDAASYAGPGGIIMTAQIDLGKRLVKGQKMSVKEFNTLVKGADPEDLETALSAWDQDTNKAVNYPHLKEGACEVTHKGN